MKKTPPELVLSRNVLALRKAKGWSQRELAERCAADQKTISNLEAPANGRDAPSPTLHTIESVASALGVTLWQLLCPYEQCLAFNSADLEYLTRQFATVSEPTRTYIKSVLQREANN